MPHDLIIRGGLIVDGTGGAPYSGDVAVDGDTIVAVGQVDGRGKQEIKADGAVVSPGFIDLHTHLDAQVAWDPLLTPSSHHGVSTVLMGNCAVSFAPCKKADRTFLAEMMETVEDIPRDAILTGLPWDWESYGEYLNSVETMQPALNVAGLVGHAAIRYHVMGDRSMDENPNAQEIAQIAELAGKSVREGAVGFSTNRLPAHRVPDGRAIPGTYAEAEELEAVARAVAAEGGLMQNVPWYSKDAIEKDLDLIGRQAKAGGGRVLFSVVETNTFKFDDPHHIIENYRAQGCEIYGTTVPRCGGNVSNIQTVILFPGWEKLRAIAPEKRLEAIRDDAFRTELIDAAKANPKSEGFAKSLRWLGDGDRPIYTKTEADNLAAMARELGEHPAETWLRLMLVTNGKAAFHQPFFNKDFDAVEDLMNRDWVVPGLGDAGAHVSVIIDAGWPSFLLSHWVRDEQKLNLATAIHRMTARPAAVMALGDRGVLAPGKRADINVIDLDRVEERQPRVVQDLPLGKSRLTQPAVGYLATLVNGQVIVRNDELTGNRSGQVLRGGK
ncbi:MAG: N-acyl-D-amino-acid deacylase family protein [Pseudomonadales bacterium]|jgi:N-acyl-D-amino-acid deacylase|tara:strand:+ start:349 stop:2010 length:1662 start_codon:yes stop_codon:yes gene_type:complete